MWQVYILKCADKTFYTGITTDLERRVGEHNSSDLGARYTSGRRPVRLVYAQNFANRSLASKEEIRIKNLSREEKIDMIKKYVSIKK
ncbi:GIY-YIG nuclease family protein [Candidatus Parcubacteria bacterium]|nr:GIY-YIG nuclease family protein [Patescibacteria group bacterium]MBU4309345.1 GIY-YIG nuclease family protein [Patescibacteria group bacterium]MBU4431841.1 GIY-YIG nuclease family protein [Patescibacteria group bacterium]MBU4577706.1 GIY-YIG nuclease family protein [Patescibacteria group bacterium]MCG2697392.1 GIY-YIG nuclease family protein [Candidatus Parcubacteria bacterium]